MFQGKPPRGPCVALGHTQRIRDDRVQVNDGVLLPPSDGDNPYGPAGSEGPAMGAPHGLTEAQRAALRTSAVVTHASHVARYHRSLTTMQLRARMDARFCTFLTWYYGSSEIDAWARVLPVDVLSFFALDLLPVNVRSGLDAPAGQTFANWVTALRQVFLQRFPNTPPWHAAESGRPAGGNPFESQEVHEAVDTYVRERNRSGTRQRSAVPMGRAKAEALFDHLEHHLQPLLGVDGLPLPRTMRDVEPSLLLARDATLFTLLWNAQRKCRGGDLFPLKWADVIVGNESVARRPLRTVPGASDTQGGVLYLAIEHDKVWVAQRPPSIVVAALPDAPAHHCPVYQLKRLNRLMLASACASSVYVFANLGRAAVSNHMQSNNATQRLAKHLRDMGAHDGETIHSFRRGAAQDLAAGGATFDEVCTHLGITTPAVARRYMDVARHCR